MLTAHTRPLGELHEVVDADTIWVTDREEMEVRFVLHYRGDLKANGGPEHKHEIRKIFHRQLAERWKHPPLASRPGLLRQKGDPAYLSAIRRGDKSLVRPLGDYDFVPLISEAMHVVASISVTLLRPEAPGKLLTQGGDIDNRLKTLFDSLTMPRHANALPKALPAADEKPFFFCLFEDDNLVSELTVRTEQLLEPGVAKNTVDLFIDVRTSVTLVTASNTDFS